VELLVIKLPAEEWEKMAEDAHVICFNEKRPSYINRIDYALLVVDKMTERPLSYITVKEFDDETVYWQHGGGFPGTIGIPAYRAYNACLQYSENKYKRIFTLIQNTNVPMLKMAMKVGFRVIGVKTISKDIMLEHLIEFNKGE
jgi:hypothetical protein